MIKIIGSILIITASSIIGFTFSLDLKKRVYQLREMQRSLLQLENEILFAHTILPEAFLKISTKSKEPICSLFRLVADKLASNIVESVYEAFIKSYEELKEDFRLTKEDVGLISDLARSLGESDIEGHKKIFSLVDNYLTKSIEKADNQLMKNSKMYKFLGFSFGAVVVILLI